MQPSLRAPKRILLISGFFPPFAPMAGVRASKLAKYLLSAGYDVRVLAARDLPYPPVLPLEIPAERVIYSRWLDVNGPVKFTASLVPRKSGTPARQAQDERRPETSTQPPSGTSEGWSRRTFRRFRRAYLEATNWPDPQIGWLPFALRDGDAVLKKWRADLIYVSAPPLTGLLAASRLARRHHIPWIAEFRDLWVDHPYYDASPLRRALERRHEQAVLKSARAFVTVSDVWTELLWKRFGKPTKTVLNGFDPDDYPEAASETRASASELTLLYTGTLYVGRRDPRPVFDAIRLLGEEGRCVKVEFYGADERSVARMASVAGVSGQVRVHPAVPYGEVVELQRTADILLLLRWNDPSERGVVPGKLFEYIAARRPILSLGFQEGAVSDIIASRQAGVISNSPADIASHLRRWLNQKRAHGQVPALPISCRAGLSRHEQFEALTAFIDLACRSEIESRDEGDETPSSSRSLLLQRDASN